ncbi:MAG: hypothetical protein Q7R60_03680 [bacterium]|nr:hypothetical protein [bacterium]
MISQWFEYKEQAISLREEGLSIREIEKLLSIPRSTLSGWFKHIKLSEEQKLKLSHSSELNLIKARYKANQWHRDQKAQRIKKAQDEALEVFNKIKLDENVIELALAMLYLGEGAKNNVTAIGNSDPLILNFFITVLVKQYGMSPTKIRCELHLRMDQNAEEMKKYWSKELKLPISNFRSVLFDKRTAGRATYPNYKGVCLVYAGNIAIQRKLISIYNLFCREVIETRTVSSTG